MQAVVAKREYATAATELVPMKAWQLKYALVRQTVHELLDTRISSDPVSCHHAGPRKMIAYSSKPQDQLAHLDEQHMVWQCEDQTDKVAEQDDDVLPGDDAAPLRPQGVKQPPCTTAQLQQAAGCQVGGDSCNAWGIAPVLACGGGNRDRQVVEEQQHGGKHQDCLICPLHKARQSGLGPVHGDIIPSKHSMNLRRAQGLVHTKLAS